jgi:hypothetical protein
MDAGETTDAGDSGEAGGTMKITIEPTSGDYPEQQSVTVGHIADDLNIDQIGKLIEAALLGYGFHPENVKRLFAE